MKSKKKISLADIANSLGLSKTTVSMVLNNQGDANGINKETQKRVQAKAKELNYKPNQIARGLRLGKSNTIGLIVADISNRFYARISRSIEDSASILGYNLMFCSSEEDATKESDLITILKERQVDGLILSSTQVSNEEILRLKQEDYPFVLIDRYFPRVSTNAVTVDNYKGAFDAVEHLIKAGYQKIAELKISPSHLSTIRDRDLGYKAALKKHNIRFNKNLIREIPFDNLKESVFKELKSLLMPPTSVDAIFVLNNNLAIACLECIREMNLRIPQDIALLSFDDLDIFKICHPPITAVAQPVEEIGKKAVDILIKAINNKGKTPQYEHVVLPTSLVVRESCGSYIHQIGSRPMA